MAIKGFRLKATNIDIANADLARASLEVVSAGADEKRTNHELLNYPQRSDFAKAFRHRLPVCEKIVA